MLTFETPTSEQDSGFSLPIKQLKVLSAIRRHPGMVITTSNRFSYLRSLRVLVGSMKVSEIRKAVAALARMRLICAHKPEFADNSEPPRWYDSDYKFPASDRSQPVSLFGVTQSIDLGEQTWTPPSYLTARTGSTDSALLEDLRTEANKSEKRSTIAIGLQAKADLASRTEEGLMPHIRAIPDPNCNLAESIRGRSYSSKGGELAAQIVLRQMAPGTLIYGQDLQDATKTKLTKFKNITASLRFLGVIRSDWIPPWQRKLGYRLILPSEKIFNLGDAVVYLPSTRSEKFGEVIDFKPHPQNPDQLCPIVSIEGGGTQFGSDDVLFKLWQCSA